MGNKNGHVVPDVTQLPQISEAVDSGDPEKQLIACRMVRQILSAHPDQKIGSIIDSVIESGIVPKCIAALKESESSSEIQAEVAKIIASIASGNEDNVQYLIMEGALNPLVQLVNSENLDIVEQAVWALGNIVGERPSPSPNARDAVINAGVVPKLISLAQPLKTSASLLRALAWTICNLCRTRSLELSWRTVDLVLPPLHRLVNMEPAQIPVNACWALFHLTSVDDDYYDAYLKIRSVLSSGVTARLIQILNSVEPDSKLINPCLHTIGHIVMGDGAAEHHINQVMGSGPIIPMLGRLLEFTKCCETAKDAAELIWKIVERGRPVYCIAVINGGAVPTLVKTMYARKPQECGRPSTAARFSMLAVKTMLQTPEHRAYLCQRQNGVIPAICSMFNYMDDEDTILAALRTLQRIMYAERENEILLHEYKKQVEECAGLDMLDQIQDDHEDEEGAGDESEIYKLASEIMDKYFQDPNEVKPAKIQRQDV